MSNAYRDDTDSLRARIHHLEEALAVRACELEALRQRSSDENAVFDRLQVALRQKPSPRLRPLAWVGLAVTVGLSGAGFLFVRSRVTPRVSVPLWAEVAAPNVPSPRVADDPCATLGVRLTVAGEDAGAFAHSEHDRADHKYHRDGTRSPWVTVEGGPISVRIVGDPLRGDVGRTQLSYLTIVTQGETEAYRLARAGKSLMEVTGADGERISGRFEADVSRVAEPTREPPFGTAVVRVRGTFCLPAAPANPSDTGP